MGKQQNKAENNIPTPALGKGMAAILDENSTASPMFAPKTNFITNPEWEKDKADKDNAIVENDRLNEDVVNLTHTIISLRNDVLLLQSANEQLSDVNKELNKENDVFVKENAGLFDRMQKAESKVSELEALDLENNVLVKRAELEQLIAERAEFEADIVSLVSVFASFTGIFSGDLGPLKIAGIVVKMVSDQSRMAQISGIVPIINKYTQTPENNER